MEHRAVSIEIGTIKTLIGTVTAKTAEGVQRTLQTGDIVFQDDIIVTGEFGAVEIELTDGSLVDLGRNPEAILDPDTLYLEDNAITDVDVIQQAILGGADPTQNAEPTTAGPEATGSNEDTNIVQVQHLAPETTPGSGFDTSGINFTFVEEIEEFDDLLNDASASNVDLIPVNSAVAANEAGLATGSDAASDSETVAGQLTVAGDTVEYALIGNGRGNND